MRFIKTFRLFESYSQNYNNLMGKLLHLYGSIPLTKEKASVVISKIVLATKGEFWKLGEGVDIDYYKLHDKIRFADYFDSFLSSKDSRGHNFEGLVAGIFGGKLSQRGAKSDLTIDGRRMSVKFIDHKGKAPEIGRFKSLIGNSPDNDLVKSGGGLTRIFKSGDGELKKYLWDNYISGGIDGWILGYPDDLEDPANIVVNYMAADEMYKLLMSGLVVSPKGGYGDLYSLALSSKWVSVGSYLASSVKIPYVLVSELEEELEDIKSGNWAEGVFGEMAAKMRPDVLRWIRLNRDVVIKRLGEI